MRETMSTICSMASPSPSAAPSCLAPGRSCCCLAPEVPDLSPQRARGRRPPVSAGHVKKPDLLCMRPVERIDRLGGGLQQHLAALSRSDSRTASVSRRHCWACARVPRRFVSPDRRSEPELKRLCIVMVRANRACVTLFGECAETSCLIQGDVDDRPVRPLRPPPDLRSLRSSIAGNLATMPLVAIAAQSWRTSSCVSALSESAARPGA